MKFKKFLYGLIAVAVAACMLTTTLYIERRQNIAAAANAGAWVQDGKFIYTVNPDGETVTLTEYNVDYNNPVDKIVIPEIVTDKDGNNYTVTEIGGGYSGVISFTLDPFTVELPATVTKINNNAFANSYLSSINIPDGVETIGDYAFSSSGLTSIDIPGSVKSIGTSAFSYATSLTSVTLGDGVESIGDLAFYRCVIKSIVIPSSVTNIGGGAFCATSIESVTIPANVQTLGNEVFSDCGKLKVVKFEDGMSVRMIPNRMFYNCMSLETVNIPNSVVAIGNSAFEKCSQLKDIDIPNSVTSIGQKAFQASGLTEVRIPENVGTIGDHAFASCNNLSKANIPAGIVVLGNEAFPDNTVVTYNGTEAQWDALYPKPTGNYINNIIFEGGKGAPITELLSAPTEVSYVSLDETSVLISWTPVRGASKYVFLYCKSDYDAGHNYSYWYMVYIPSNSIDEYGKVTIELTGLAINQQYALTVAAIDEEGTVGKLYHEPGDKHFMFKAEQVQGFSRPSTSHTIVGTETLDDPGLSSFQPQIIIKKVDKDTQEPLADAVFSVYTDRACTKLLKTETTNENGEAVFNISIDDWLKNQMYYIKETEAPSGYMISDTVYKAEFDADKTQRGKIAAFYGVLDPDNPRALPTDTTPPVFENEKGSDPDSSSTPTPPTSTSPPYNPPPTSSDPDSSDPESPDPNTSNPESPDPNSSNPGTSDPYSSEPDSSNPETSEPDSSNPPSNPPTGSALAFLVPAVLASGAMVIAALKRRRN